MMYKVLDERGVARNGSDFQYSLPTVNSPGDWHRLSEEVALQHCQTGFHATKTPAKWVSEKSYIIYRCEVGGGLAYDDESEKGCYRSIRLLERLSDTEHLNHFVVLSGTHEVNEGKWLAVGTAKVTALGSSQVKACDSSQVLALDSSQVTAWGSSKVTACDSSQVTACDSSRVTARDSSQVTAYDSSQVTAWDSSQVTAWDSSQVTACDSSIVIDHRVDKVYTVADFIMEKFKK